MTQDTTHASQRQPDATDIQAIRLAIGSFSDALPNEEADELLAIGLRQRLRADNPLADDTDTASPADSAPAADGLAVFNIPAELGNGNLRTVTIDGQTWFVAADFAEVLGYEHVPNMMRMVDDDEAAVHKVNTRSWNGVVQAREMSIVNESGLFALTLKSQRDEAKPFRRWITSEVLPSIVRTGSYSDDSGQMGQTLGQAMAGKLGLDAPATPAAHKPDTSAMSAVLAMLLPLLLPLLPALVAAVTGWLNRQASSPAHDLPKLAQPDYMGEPWFAVLQAVCCIHERKEVAQRLGVSAPFLSQVLNGSGKYGRGQASTHNLAERTLRCFANLTPPRAQRGKTTVTVEH